MGETDNIQHDAAVAAFRKKHNDAVAEMSEQIDHLTKMKQKIDKEKEIMKREGEELKSHFDRLTIDKAHSEKQGKNLQAQILEVQAKYDECYRCIGDYENNKKKISSENTDLVRQLEDLEAQIHSLSKLTITYGAQLSDMQNAAKVENRDRVSILNKYRNLEHDFEGLQEQLHEDAETKHALGRDLAKANAEALMYRSKYENEGIVRAEELEVAGLKLASALEEAEQQIEQLKYKNAALEKVKARISGELEAMHKDTENSQALAASAEKKQRTFEKIIGEWKIKVDELAHDLDVSQQDARNHSAELFKMKAKYDEGMEQLDNITRENKVLGEDVGDLMDQMCEGSKNMNEMAKAVKKYEAEKDDLQGALEEAEIALEAAEAKVLKGQLELSHAKQDIERKVTEKEEEQEATRKVQFAAIENMQASLEAEAKGKAEALRAKAKLEADINDLEIALDHANRANSDISMTIKKYHLEMKDLQDKYAEEQRLGSEYREQYSIAERRANSLHAELEESRTLLEQSDRGRRQAEADNSQDLTKQKKILEGQTKDLQMKLEEAETVALKEGKRAVVKLENRIHEMEVQFNDENNKYSESQKVLRKYERRIKELTFQSEEDKKNHEKMQDLSDKLQQKVKTYKRQIDEAEEIAAVNLAKYRKSQGDIDSVP